MATDHRAIEQEHGHIESEPALQGRVGVHVHHFDRRQRHGLGERPQLGDHLLAEMAVAAMHYGENGSAFQFGGGECAKGLGGSAPSVSGGAEPETFSPFTESAMKRTVAAGASPTAVTLWPSTMVEKA